MKAHILNFFEIINADALRLNYRLVDVDGPFDPDLGDGDVAERNLNQLVKRIQFEEKIPVAIEAGGPLPRLAIPADHELSKLEYDLAPDVATLRLRDEESPVSLVGPKSESSRVGLSFLSWYLRSPLFRDEHLWSTGSSTYFNKCPLNFKRDDREIDIYRGFGFRVGYVDDRLGVWVRVTHRYAETRWLLDGYDNATIHQQLRMRHMLYHYGNNWFPVQLLGLTGKSVERQMIVLDGTSDSVSVFDYTLRQVGGQRAPAFIQSLGKNSPAIAFRYPNNDKRRLGAAALCKLLVRNEDPRVRDVHTHSLIDPDSRFVEHRRIVEQYLQKASFGEIPICVRPSALQVEPKHFPIPAQEFGQGKILLVGQNPRRGEVSIRDYAKKRLDLLLSADGGFAVNSQFDAQYILIPMSQERKVAEDFQDRLEKTIRSLTKRSYALTRIIFDDRDARTLKRQVDAVIGSIRQAGVQSGKGLLMLPAQAQPDLHNFLKRKLGKHFQFQCVNGRKVKEFYQLSGQDGRAVYSVRDSLSSRYVSYLRLTAMGLLLVNRQWPWVLANKTRYDMYIGLDVLDNTAAFTFFRDGGRQCFIRTVQSEQSEKLLRKQVRTVVYENLRESLQNAQSVPSSIVLRRDGRAYRSEWLGFRDAIEQLKKDDILPDDVIYGVVEVHKGTAEGMRLVAENDNLTLSNATVGAWKEISPKEGIVCTTGAPFSLRGTADPVLLRVAAGDLSLEHSLQDFFDMSQLCWSKPDGLIRLSIDLKLCDEQLRVVACAVDEDEAQFGDEEDEVSEERHAVGWNN